MNCLFKLFAVLVLLPGCAVASVYRCTGDDGAVSYQDQPCAAGEQQRQLASDQKIVLEGDDFEMVKLVVPGVGLAMVALFDHMEHMTRKHGTEAATIAIRAKSGHEPMEMQITFFASQHGTEYTQSLVADELARISPALRQQPMPVGSERWTFETAIGDAQMTSYHRPGGSPVAGAWDTVTVGFVAHPEVVAAVTILNNGKTSDSLRDALKVYNMFQVAVGNKLLQ